MKSLLCSCFSKTVLFIAPLALSFDGPTAVKAGDRDTLSLGAVRPGILGDRSESARGYLKVYSATNEFKKGDARYFPHSPYAIYTLDGKLFKNVRNQRSADDEIPELVTLPVETYVVEARSQRGGYVDILVVIKEDQETILDLDLWEPRTQRRTAPT
jgi:hypothetical protein